MASSYALPTSALPHHHMHAHAHSHSHSPVPLSAFKTSMTNGGYHTHTHSHGGAHNHSHDHGHGHDHDHEHEHDHSSHNHNHTQSTSSAHSHSSSNGHAVTSRRAPPAMLTPSWTTETTAGGKTVITPTRATFASPYEPPNPSNVAHAHHDHNTGEKSWMTKLLLRYTSSWPLLHSIMVEKDSRRILYFMTLNFSFMAVQAFYGYVTDSLGLLSDSIHMFFDCVALMVGLFAAVASKWPSSQRFPYGFGKIETLSGFANGILLMLLSVEITFEAFERLWEGTKTKRLGELFIVSTLGLLVNLLGMAAFGHHHHGHGHGHSHGSHDHGHSLGHSHSHSHVHDHHGHGHDHGDCKSHSEKHSHSHDHGHGHGHSHDNQNMEGIYLHVLADTLGSVSVVVSTALTYFTGWAGWDPLASVLIAALIGLSARPLVMSAAERLLLSIPDDVEYNLRNTLAGILRQRGVVGYAAPKFWMDDRAGSEGSGDKLLGVVHVVAARGANMDDVRERVREYLLRDGGMDIVVQVEREGDTSCWCGVGKNTSPISAGTNVGSLRGLPASGGAY